MGLRIPEVLMAPSVVGETGLSLLASGGDLVLLLTRPFPGLVLKRHPCTLALAA